MGNDMAQGETDYFRIGMLGPSGVGKTSLVTAILQQSLMLMASGGLPMRPVGRATEERLDRNQQDLYSHLISGTFSTDAVRTTAEPFNFRLQIAYESQALIDIELRDFPGGWMIDQETSGRTGSDWADLRGFLAMATILLVPVDSVLLMEATGAGRQRALSRLAALDEMKAAVGEWALARGSNPDEPALVVFCPVKCESYFDDNGGERDLSAQLRQQITQAYAAVLQTVREKAPNARILYAPVDTIGCVELTGVEWRGEFEPVASYRIREPEKISRAGASDVVRALYRQLFRIRRAALAVEAGDFDEAAREARELAEERFGLFRQFWLWISGERAVRRQAASAAAAQATAATQRVGELDELLLGIGDPAYGPRVRDLTHRMRVFVRTRGRFADYQFIGIAPEAPWWRRYADVTDLERPTVLVESDGQTWRAYVSGLASQRQDRILRGIRLDLVLDGECNPAEGEDHDLALAIITTFLADLAEESDAEAPGIRLGDAIDEAEIEQWLVSRDASTSSLAAAAVRDAYRGLGATQARSDEPPDGSWIGGLGNAASRAAFVALTRQLLAGRSGQALMLGLVENAGDTAQIPAGEGNLGVLVSRSGPLYGAEPRKLRR